MAGNPRPVALSNKGVTADDGRDARFTDRKIPMWARVSGVFSLAVWFAVGAAGRAIGAL